MGAPDMEPSAGTERDARTPTGRCAAAAARGGGADTQTSRARGTETTVDACFSSGCGELPRRHSRRPRRGGAPASCGRRPRGRTPDGTSNTVHSGGGRYFKYRPPLGPFRPFDQDCAAEIIQKSPILHHFPPSLAMTPSQRQGAGEPGAPAPPVPGSRWSAHPQNGMLDGAITSTLHCSACSPP